MQTMRLPEHAGLETCIVREGRRQEMLFRPSNSNGERSEATEPWQAGSKSPVGGSSIIESSGMDSLFTDV